MTTPPHGSLPLHIRSPTANSGPLSNIGTLFLPPKTFDDRTLERDFIQDYGQHFLFHRRAALLLSLLVWILYYGWDFYNIYHTPAVLPYLGIILAFRIFGAVTILIAFLMSLRRDMARDRYATALLSATAILGFLTILGIIVVVPFPFNYLLYFVGLLLVMAFTFGLLRLRAAWVYVVMTVCVSLSYVLLSLSARDVYHHLLFQWPVPPSVSVGIFLKANPGVGTIESYYYWAATSFLISFALVGCVVSVELERTARNAFRRETQLSAANDELKEAERAANKQNEALTQAYLALRAAEEENRAKTDAIITAKEDLRALAERQNRAKTQFLAAAAHDLRQPLQVISNSLYLASHAIEQHDGPGLTAALEAAREAAATETRLFNAILDFSNFDAGGVTPSIRAVEVCQILADVLQSYEVSAQKAKVSLRCRKHMRPSIYAWTDGTLLRRVLANLTENAIKYHDAEKARPIVFLGAVVVGGRVRVTVIDNGIGIPRENWSEIYNPLVQLETLSRPHERGFGLGLAIVHEIVSLLPAHELTMRSEVGGGTRFSVEMPFADAPISPGISPSGKPYAPSRPHDLPIFAIYVEDDERVRSTVTALFDANDIMHSAAASVDELIDVLRRLEVPPDLIVSDYKLPAGKSAADVQELVNRHFEAVVPLVVVTANVAEARSNVMLSPRFILEKPVSADALLEASYCCVDEDATLLPDDSRLSPAEKSMT